MLIRWFREKPSVELPALGGAGEQRRERPKINQESEEEEIEVDESMIQDEADAPVDEGIERFRQLLDHELKKQESRALRGDTKRQRTLSQEFATIATELQGMQGDRQAEDGGLSMKELFQTAVGIEFDRFKSGRTIENTIHYFDKELPKAQKQLSELPANSPRRIDIQKKIGAIQMIRSALGKVTNT